MSAKQFHQAAPVMPPQKPGVSVVIPAYKAKMCLIDAIDSAYEQGLNPDEFEVIVVDDKYPSGDLTARAEHERVFREIERRRKAEPEKYANLTVMNSGPNGLNNGQSAARNAAIRAAKYPFIACLDSDDMYVFDPEYLKTRGSYLQRAMKILAKYPDIAFVDCNFYLFGSGCDEAYGDVLSANMLNRFIAKDRIMSVKAMFRKEDAFNEHMQGFHTGLKSGEDSYFFLKLMQTRMKRGRGVDAILLPEPYYLYKQHPDGAGSVSQRQVTEDHKRTVNQISMECLPYIRNYKTALRRARPSEAILEAEYPQSFSSWLLYRWRDYREHESVKLPDLEEMGIDPRF